MCRASFFAGILFVLTLGSSEAVEILRVPTDVSTLQDAIGQISNGGIIEMEDGSYSAPSGGWRILNPNKHFTIRAASGATVILDGGNSQPVINYQATAAALQGAVVFEDLIISNGLSTADGMAGGVTMYKARATFFGCTFKENVCNASTTAGGGVGVFDSSEAVFSGCTWIGNIAKNGGGAGSIYNGIAHVYESQVIDNRCNVSDHRPSSTGGAFAVVYGWLWVANTRFEGNQAGFAGGAIYTLAPWAEPWDQPLTEAVIANCTFVENVAVPDPVVTTPSPTEGGAIHAEDQCQVTAYNSRFVNNNANLGGAVSGYRSKINIESSVFQGNYAEIVGSSCGTGGSIKVHSNDSGSGTTNYPSVSLTVRDTWFQGAYGGVSVNAQSAGGINSLGDSKRNYGLSGSPVIGNPSVNRATVVLENIVFTDFFVEKNGLNCSGLGGSLTASLVDLEMQNGLVMASSALGTGASGGGLRIVIESDAAISGFTLAQNMADKFGAGVYAQAVNITMDDCNFIENEILTPQFGAAIFNGPAVDLYDQDFDVTGTISNSTFSDNYGMPVSEDDHDEGPINAVQYNGNTFYNVTYGEQIYKNPITTKLTVAELNDVVVTRDNGVPSTVKSLLDNTWVPSALTVKKIMGLPPTIIPAAAAGDPETSTKSYLGYAWQGSATLDGNPVSNGIGMQEATVGVHTLTVDGEPTSVEIRPGPLPDATFSASPAFISSGQDSELSWATTGGVYLGMYINLGVDFVAGSSGATSVSPTVTTTYHLWVFTEEGVTEQSVTVWVDEVPGQIFTDGFESGDFTLWTRT